MMEASANTKPVTGKFEKIAYGVFVLAGIYFLFTKDYSNAVVFWGLAPIFEPFNAIGCSKDSNASSDCSSISRHVFSILMIIALISSLIVVCNDAVLPQHDSQ